MNKLDSEGKLDKGNSEPFADEARFFTESRLLQRDVQVILETFNNNNFVGSVVHKVRDQLWLWYSVRSSCGLLWHAVRKLMPTYPCLVRA